MSDKNSPPKRARSPHLFAVSFQNLVYEIYVASRLFVRLAAQLVSVQRVANFALFPGGT